MTTYPIPPKVLDRIRTLFALSQGAQLAATAAMNVAQQAEQRYQDYVGMFRESVGIGPDVKCRLDLDTGTLVQEGTEP